MVLQTGSIIARQVMGNPKPSLVDITFVESFILVLLLREETDDAKFLTRVVKTKWNSQDNIEAVRQTYANL